MKVRNYIQNMILHLEEQGMKQVQFLSAANCTLVKNGVQETYLIENTDLDAECYGIDLGEIDGGVILQGSKIRIYGVPKRKRKGMTFSYYVVLERR